VGCQGLGTARQLEDGIVCSAEALQALLRAGGCCRRRLVVAHAVDEFGPLDDTGQSLVRHAEVRLRKNSQSPCPVWCRWQAFRAWSCLHLHVNLKRHLLKPSNNSPLDLPHISTLLPNPLYQRGRHARDRSIAYRFHAQSIVFLPDPDSSTSSLALYLLFIPSYRHTSSTVSLSEHFTSRHHGYLDSRPSSFARVL
jgi:hypothetical protein